MGNCWSRTTRRDEVTRVSSRSRSRRQSRGFSRTIQESQLFHTLQNVSDSQPSESLNESSSDHLTQSPQGGHAGESSTIQDPGMGILEDAHLLEVAQRITNEKELQHLGLNILKVRANTVDSALTNKKDIQDAALVVLKTWYHNQESTEKAYSNLYRELVNNGRQLWANELKQSVTGTVDSETLPEHEFDFIQTRVKKALEQRYKDFLKHDWLEEGLSFSLMKYYTDLSWARMVNKPMEKKRKPMEGMDDILKVPAAGRKCVKILIEAGSGMGKSSSMAYFAMKWVKDEIGEFPFDFVFLIQLRNVDENCSLAKLIIDEHDLEKKDVELVKLILAGKTKFKVLLLLDGHDEYTPGTNTELDTGIEKTVGNCFLILTSRPKEGKDFTGKIRKKMDGEVVIEGFSEENIRKCCSRYLGRKEARTFLEEAKKQADLYELLKVPIILLITSVLYNEHEKKSLAEVDKKGLPERKTELYENLYEFLMDRSTLKSNNYSCYSSDIPNLQGMLQILGKFAWEALQKDDKQLLIKKAALEKECPDIMKLGLLHVVGVRKATARKQPAYFSYEHKSLQEFGASKFLTKRLETSENIKETLKELFPSWEAVQRYREVVIFVAGLMKDSRPLVQQLYEKYVEYYLNEMRTNREPSIDADLFESLHKECTVRLFDHPLHNRYFNYYNHMGDNIDTTPVYIPSRIFHFCGLHEDVVLGEDKEQGAEIPECALYIIMVREEVTESLLSKCGIISERQAVTDLQMRHDRCNDASKAEAPILSRNIQSLYIRYCHSSSSFIRNIFQQLHDCVTLTNLKLEYLDLRDVEEDLDKLLNNLVSNHVEGLSQNELRINFKRNKLSAKLAAKWNECCEGITSIDGDISYDY